jgi:hypothetical protein
MRGEFHGGFCDGHSHPVGREPPETLAPQCTLGAGIVANGRYIRSEIRRADRDDHLPSTTETAIYQWEPASAQGSTSRATD